ncbi:unnamed protein product [Acanthoscelides obtectus]|uniref:Uncharacterized protein n=1 Tax=Acanthoscelides obtectus TaxID=200917 RepID=A0A9P0L122_ACAOB|nr:unnamed protein product [Acanthoscelides obtectus]CAK1635883.1 hypothetical protein AOBTE_LOCUS9590 [Acanthoscelides obtectus]
MWQMLEEENLVLYQKLDEPSDALQGENQAPSEKVGPVSAKSAQHCISPQTNGLRIRHCRTWATVDARGSSASNTWSRQINLL